MRKIKQSHTEHAHRFKPKSFMKHYLLQPGGQASNSSRKMNGKMRVFTRHLRPRGALRHRRRPRLRLRKNQENAPQVEDKNKRSDLKRNHRQKNSINHPEDKGKIRKPPDHDRRAAPNDTTDHAPQKDYKKTVDKTPTESRIRIRKGVAQKTRTSGKIHYRHVRTLRTADRLQSQY
jgi:hypothetical protein